MSEDSKKPPEYWKKVLSKEQFDVCWNAGTERPFSGEYWNTKDAGTYLCVCCKNPLFSSDTKYDSGTGWPSFFQPVKEHSVKLKEDNSHFMKRVEVVCGKCGSHLGHLFEDGPAPTGKRYCMNSCSMELARTGGK